MNLRIWKWLTGEKITVSDGTPPQGKGDSTIKAPTKERTPDNPAEDPETLGMPETPVEIPVNGVIDLHPFLPNETISVLEEYLRCCIEQQIATVKVIHGKGKGVQMNRVHAFLRTHPEVLSFGLDSSGPSGWGATLIYLRLPRP